MQFSLAFESSYDLVAIYTIVNSNIITGCIKKSFVLERKLSTYTDVDFFYCCLRMLASVSIILGTPPPTIGHKRSQRLGTVTSRIAPWNTGNLARPQ